MTALLSARVYSFMSLFSHSKIQDQSFSLLPFLLLVLSHGCTVLVELHPAETHQIMLVSLSIHSLAYSVIYSHIYLFHSLSTLTDAKVFL